MATPSFIVKFKDRSDLFNGLAAIEKIPGIGRRAEIAKNDTLILSGHSGNLKAEMAEKLADIPGVMKVITPVAKKPRL